MAVPQFIQPSAGDFRWFMANRPMAMIGSATQNLIPATAAIPSPGQVVLISAVSSDVFDRYGVVDLLSNPAGGTFNGDLSYPVGLCEVGYYAASASMTWSATGAQATTVSGSPGTVRRLSLLFNGTSVASGTSTLDTDCNLGQTAVGWATNGNGNSATHLVALNSVWVTSAVVHVTQPTDILSLVLFWDCNSIGSGATITSQGVCGYSSAYLSMEYLGN